MMVNQLTRVCHCGKTFSRKAYEILRVESAGGKPCCSKSCSASNAARHRSADSKAKSLEILLSSNLTKKRGFSKPDNYSGLTRLLSYCRRRKNKGNFNLDLDYLKQLWDQQGGKCAYLGNTLTLPSSRGYRTDPRILASIDRINPNLGYVKGNIQFISSSMNYLKHDMLHEEMLEYLDLIRRS